MPFPMKVQPIDEKSIVRADQAKPVAKSRLKRLFERQFLGVLRNSSSDRLVPGGDLEPSSICLDKMVRNFMEDAGNEKPSRCGRSRCNCFNGNCDDSSDDDMDFQPLGDPPMISASSAPGDAVDVVKGLIICASLSERNLLADVSNILERIKNHKRKDECREAVLDGLRSLGYDAAICKTRWDRTPLFPAGEYEYIDAMVDRGDRLLVDVDFRSEFEIARSTKSYRAVLQSLPCIFVGREDRVSQIVTAVSEAARLSLKKKGLHFPPWRKPEYMMAKWLSPCVRSTPSDSKLPTNGVGDEKEEPNDSIGEKASVVVAKRSAGKQKPSATAPSPWEPLEVKPKASHKGAKMVTGLASVFSENT